MARGSPTSRSRILEEKKQEKAARGILALFFLRLSWELPALSIAVSRAIAELNSGANSAPS